MKTLRAIIDYLRFKQYKEVRISLSIPIVNQLLQYFNGKVKTNKGFIYGTISKHNVFIDLLDSADHQEHYAFYGRNIIGEYRQVTRLEFDVDTDFKFLELNAENRTMIYTNKVFLNVAYNGVMIAIYDRHGNVVVYSIDCLKQKLIKLK